ncbi:MAG: hypothetical protein EOO18_11095 [Chryseobacterium sp.]|nr:MAG: hypothetical protein EOO18_11095 [Chryseobacterium sp.]
MKNTNKTILAFLFLSGALLASCTSGTSEKKTVEQVTTTVTDSIKPLKGCYIAVIKKDTIQLAITSVNGSAVEGSLDYKFFEKDKNKGTFQGQFNDGVLVADYTFKSEGSTSERQVIFKKVGDDMVEGHGESETKGNKEVFKDQKAVNFDGSIVLKRTENCLP